MTLRLAMNVAFTLLMAGSLATAEPKAMTCAEYLADDKGSRDRITGSFLWVWLLDNRESLSTNQAGSAIAIIPELRILLDRHCSTSGGEVAPAAAEVIGGMAAALAANPDLR